MIPLRMNWADLEEQAWDFIEDTQFDARTIVNIFDNDFTQIGVACNCHDIYGEICVVELGSHVEGIEHLETITHNVLRYGNWLEHDHVNEEDTMPIPEFLPKGSANCKRGRNDTICAENEPVSSFPSSFLSSGPVQDYQDVAHAVYTAINILRDDVSDFIDDYIKLPYTVKVMNNWEDFYP